MYKYNTCIFFITFNSLNLKYYKKLKFHFLIILVIIYGDKWFIVHNASPFFWLCIWSNFDFWNVYVYT